MEKKHEPAAAETTRRELVKKLGKAAYIAPATIALLVSTKAAASP